MNSSFFMTSLQDEAREWERTTRWVALAASFAVALVRTSSLGLAADTGRFHFPVSKFVTTTIGRFVA
jgi:hypothetical protein